MTIGRGLLSVIRQSRRWTAALLPSILAASPALGQTLPVVFPAANDPLLTSLSIPATAPTQGMWSAVMPWPLVSIHAAVLPDGTVLTFGSPLGQGVQDGQVFDRWNPLNGGHVTLPNSQNVNSFCSAGILHRSGGLLVSGGNAPRDSTIGVGALLPWPRRTSTHADLGPDAGRGARLPDSGGLDLHLPGHRHHGDRARHQLSRRRFARSARPPAPAANVGEEDRRLAIHGGLCSQKGTPGSVIPPAREPANGDWQRHAFAHA